MPLTDIIRRGCTGEDPSIRIGSNPGMSNGLRVDGEVTRRGSTSAPKREKNNKEVTLKLQNGLEVPPGDPGDRTRIVR